MVAETLFISDLHLSRTRPDVTARFLRFLKQRAHGVERLYILGDLFDAWVGDDDPSPPNPAVISALKTLVQSGTSIYLQHGNRDFLIGEQFLQDSAVELLDDYTVINLYGTPTLLMHGDLLCSDDVAYLQFRAKSHTPEWQQSVLSKPLFLRLLLARWYRVRSRFHKRNKTTEIMDVNGLEVEKIMKTHKVTRLIHGHTHRPGIHHPIVAGQPAERFVLAEWNQDSTLLCWNPNKHWLESIQ